MDPISFQTYFVQAFKIVVEPVKIQYIIAIYLIWWLTNFYDFWFKWTATAAIGIHPTKVWLSQLVNFKNAIWTLGHFRRTICNKILFSNLEKMPHKMYGIYFRLPFEASCMNQASVLEWHKGFKEGRESVRDDERYGRSKKVNIPELIGQRLRVRFTMLRF